MGYSWSTQILIFDHGMLPHPSGVMATSTDVQDILELGDPGDAASGAIGKKDIMNPDKKNARSPQRL